MHQHLQRHKLAILAATGTLFLAACGGGGGGDGGNGPGPAPAPTALAITSGNYQSVAQQSLSSSQYLLGSAGLVTGADAAAAPSLLALAARQVQALPAWFRNKAGLPLVQGATTNQSTPCAGGGRIDAVLTDANGNGKIDAGDGMAMTAVACKEDGVSMDGKMEITVTSASGEFGSNSFSAGLDLKLSGFTATTGISKVSGDGLIRVSLTASGANRMSLSMDVASFSSSGRVGGTDFSQKLENFALTLQTAPQGLGFQTSSTARGALTSSSLESKRINLETAVPLLQLSGRSDPSAGQLLVRGAADSLLRMTVQSDGRVLLELDADGNGQFELSSFKSWSELH
ncbi:hypothetical protein [Paucibacter soli]|uniref:hypothetical protein n=1 Tax=Paucibacter soli TaxID=3133433 RepID=UPI0030A7CAEB